MGICPTEDSRAKPKYNRPVISTRQQFYHNVTIYCANSSKEGEKIKTRQGGTEKLVPNLENCKDHWGAAMDEWEKIYEKYERDDLYKIEDDEHDNY